MLRIFFVFLMVICFSVVSGPAVADGWLDKMLNRGSERAQDQAEGRAKVFLKNNGVSTRAINKNTNQLFNQGRSGGSSGVFTGRTNRSSGSSDYASPFAPQMQAMQEDKYTRMRQADARQQAAVDAAVASEVAQFGEFRFTPSSFSSGGIKRQLRGAATRYATDKGNAELGRVQSRLKSQ